VREMDKEESERESDWHMWDKEGLSMRRTGGAVQCGVLRQSRERIRKSWELTQ
jgi:hypothetical protein